MTGFCASDGDYTDIGALMETVDCQTTLFIANAYQGLFGQTGYLAPALVGALTIYVALYGYRLMAGHGASAPDLVKRFLALGFVLAFATNWPAYQTVFVGTITGGAEEIARMMSVATSGRAVETPTIAAALDDAVDEMTSLANNWSRRTPLGSGGFNSAAAQAQGAAVAPGALPGAPIAQNSPAGASAANMLWLSAVLFGVSSAGVLIITKASLAFLLALGPLFLMLGVFPATRGLLEGWLRTVVAGLFVLAFTLLATAGALGVVVPIIDEIANDQSVGVNDAGPVFALMIACIVFAMLIKQVVSSIAQLAAAWRLPEHADDRTESGRDFAPQPANTTPSQSANDPRIIDLVASVSRSDPASPSRAAITPTASTAGDTFDAVDRSSDIRRAPRAYRGFGSTARRTARGLS